MLFYCCRGKAGGIEPPDRRYLRITIYACRRIFDLDRKAADRRVSLMRYVLGAIHIIRDRIWTID